MKLDAQAMQSEKIAGSRRGAVFLRAWDDLSISKVHVRGVVIGCTPIGSTGYQITVDDGSGRIGVVLWTSSEEASEVTTSHPPVEQLYNRFVAVQGQLIGFRSSVQIRAQSVTIVATEEEPTEECLWWLFVRDEWEGLAATARKSALSESERQVCPCLCHSGSGIPCRTLGDMAAWPHTFVRAVTVVSSTLRNVAGTADPLVLTLEDTVRLVRENFVHAPSLQTMKCLVDCATVAAVRDLTRLKYIHQQLDGRLLIRPISNEGGTSPTAHQSEPRYPQTPAEYSSQTSESPPKKLHSEPKFYSY